MGNTDGAKVLLPSDRRLSKFGESGLESKDAPPSMMSMCGEGSFGG